MILRGVTFIAFLACIQPMAAGWTPLNQKYLCSAPKNQKLSKQLEQEQSHRNGDHMEGHQWGGGGGEWGKGTGNKNHSWQAQNRQEEVKNSIGNGEVKELICITHGHELRLGGNAGGKGGVGRRGVKGRKKGKTVIA